jgi:RNA 3'-terminal phosphate cyclase (ATP)
LPAATTLAKEGTFTTVKLSEHTRTAARLIERFTGTSFRFSERPKGGWLVEVN